MGNLLLKRAPVAKTGMLIRKPVADGSDDAIVEPGAGRIGDEDENVCHRCGA